MSDSEKKKEQAARAEINALVAEAVKAMHKAVGDLSILLGPEGAAGKIGDLTAGARDIGGAGLDDLSAVVRKNPLAWLAAALGLGLVLGLWGNRDHKS